MVVLVMIDICESILLNINCYFKQSKRSNGEIKAKLQELFEDNIADYDKLANWYDESTPQCNMIAKAEYEHYVIENYKKLMYGDSYEIKPFEW